MNMDTVGRERLQVDNWGMANCWGCLCVCYMQYCRHYWDTRGPHKISTGCPANLAILRCSTESSKRRNITLCSCTHLWDHCYPYIFDISITGNVSAVLSVYDCILSLAKHHDTFLNGKITHFHLVVIVENTEIIELYSISYDCCKKIEKLVFVNKPSQLYFALFHPLSAVCTYAAFKCFLSILTLLLSLGHSTGSLVTCKVSMYSTPLF